MKKPKEPKTKKSKLKSTSNIIAFPANRIIKVHNPPENLAEKIVEHKTEFIDYIITKNMTTLYNQLGIDGFDVGSDQFIKDFSYCVEVLKSGLFRSVNLPHPLQEFIDESVDIFESEDDLTPVNEENPT